MTVLKNNSSAGGVKRTTMDFFSGKRWRSHEQLSEGRHGVNETANSVSTLNGNVEQNSQSWLRRSFRKIKKAKVGEVS